MTSKNNRAPTDSVPNDAHGIVRPTQLPAYVGFSHHTARRMPGFPPPLQLGLRSIGWRVKDLNAWLDSRPTGYMSVEAASPNLNRSRAT